jgi:hypothetical protein
MSAGRVAPAWRLFQAWIVAAVVIRNNDGYLIP